MNKYVFCSDCGTINKLSRSDRVWNFGKCKKCKSTEIVLLDEELVPLISDLKSKGIPVYDGCAGHIIYDPDTGKFERSYHSLLVLAMTDGGYHFNIKNFDNSKPNDANYMYMEMRNLFEAINTEICHETTIWIGNIDYHITTDIDRMNYYHDDTVYTRALIQIDVGTDKEHDPFDIKGGFIDIWNCITGFVREYIDTDTESKFIPYKSVRERKIGWVEGVAPFSERVYFPI